MQETRALILESLMVIDDPRVDRTKRHSLELILFVAVCSFLCGCENFNELEMSSAPSHDTFNRVFQAVAPAQFGQCLITLTARLRAHVGGAPDDGVAAFDGKTHRRRAGSPLQTRKAPRSPRSRS
jgi:hypothetical protein